MEKIAYVYAPITIKPAWPSENRPVKPFSRFMDTAASAYTEPFCSTVSSIYILLLGLMT